MASRLISPLKLNTYSMRRPESVTLLLSVRSALALNLAIYSTLKMKLKTIQKQGNDLHKACDTVHRLKADSDDVGKNQRRQKKIDITADAVAFAATISG